MTKQEYRDLQRQHDIEQMRLEQRRLDLDSESSSLSIKRDLLHKESIALEKRRLDLEIKYTQAKIDGETGYEEDDEEDEV